MDFHPQPFAPPYHDPTKSGILCSWIMGCKDASCASHHRSKQGFGTVNVGSCYEEKQKLNTI